MPRTYVRRLATVTAVAGCALPLALPAHAHNAGHLILPDGSCHQIGSFRHAPTVGPDGVALDLMPQTPMDEYGTSFAAFQGATPIRPGPCR